MIGGPLPLSVAGVRPKFWVRCTWFAYPMGQTRRPEQPHLRIITQAARTPKQAE
jgi:hypothetical protein